MWSVVRCSVMRSRMVRFSSVAGTGGVGQFDGLRPMVVGQTYRTVLGIPSVFVASMGMWQWPQLRSSASAETDGGVDWLGFVAMSAPAKFSSVGDFDLPFTGSSLRLAVVPGLSFRADRRRWLERSGWRRRGT